MVTPHQFWRLLCESVRFLAGQESLCRNQADGILIASGSEVSLALAAKELLAAEGIDVRVVSMPCMDLFEQQPAAYKEEVLPKQVRARVAIEAGADFGWGKYVGLDGDVVTMMSDVGDEG